MRTCAHMYFSFFLCRFIFYLFLFFAVPSSAILLSRTRGPCREEVRVLVTVVLDGDSVGGVTVTVGGVYYK